MLMLWHEFMRMLLYEVRPQEAADANGMAKDRAKIANINNLVLAMQLP